MQAKHKRTFTALFARPTSGTIRWGDIEALIIALGGSVRERAGSRVLIELNGVRAVFHRPHPKPETDKGAVKSLRQFLNRAENGP
ncbi:MAG: type II toxin-antitoxin system HicA family toxin [Alphaproteobacteria bacterium]|nr:type II toxin-antitoxin system HicA family toxin [Alphaproteobacteria bacterium]